MATEGQERQYGALRERFYQSVAETLTLLHPAADYDRRQALLEVATTLASTMDLPLVWIGRREPGRSALDLVAAGAAAEYAATLRLSDDPREPGGRGPAGVALREGRPQLASVGTSGYAEWREAARRPGLDSLIVAASGTADGGQLALAAYSRAGAPTLTDELLDWAQRLADELARFWDDQAQLERNLRLSRYRDAHRTIQRILLDHPEPAAIYLTLAETLINEAAATAVIVYVPEGDTLRRAVGVGHLAELIELLPEPPTHTDDSPTPAPTQACMERTPVVRLRPSVHPDLSTAEHDRAGQERAGHERPLVGMAALGCWPIFSVSPGSNVPGEPATDRHVAAVLLLAAAEVDAFDADMRRLLDEICDTVGLALRQYHHHQLLSQERERQTYLALHDALTDLPNRRALDYHLERALARAARHQHLVAVGMLDLDDLKPINDQHGHAAGDRVLVEVARRLHDSLRSEDSVARVGGDEFVLVFEDLASEDDLAGLLERLWQSLQRPIVLGESSIEITVSLGVALYPTHGQANGEHLLRLADQAMYQVKTRKQRRSHWWALARPGGGAEIESAVESVVPAPHGAPAADLLRLSADTWQAQLPEIVKRFCSALGRHAGVAGLLRGLPPLALDAIKADLARQLQTLCYPALDLEAQRAGAVKKGASQAACGMEEAWLPEATEHLRGILVETLGAGARANRSALAIVLQRLGMEQQWQLDGMREQQRRRDVILTRIHAAAWAAHDYLQLLESVVDALATDGEVVACAVVRPDNHGELIHELVAGAIPAEYLRITNRGIAPPIRLDRESTDDDEPLRRAWRTGGIERCAHYGSDPTTAGWRDTALRHGIVSHVAVALCLPPRQSVAMLALYSPYAGGFRSESQQSFIAQIKMVLELALMRMAPRRQLAALLPAFVRKRWRNLLGDGALRMHYQPMIRLADGAVAGFEALARLLDGPGGLQLPANFMPALGAAGLMRLFRDGVIQAVALRQSLARTGLVLGMSVNVPVAALRDARYARTVETILQASGCPVGSLRFEAFEPANGTGCWALLAETGVQSLKSLDPELLEDDAALSRSLVARLSQSPFDRIKIDQAIIAQVRRDPLGTLRLVRRLIRVGHDLSMEVVVEGLESLGMVEAVSILGADFGQGFALAHPMPPETLSDWLAGFTSREQNAVPHSALGALAGALRWEERFVELFDEPWSRDRHVHAGMGGEPLRGLAHASVVLRASHQVMLEAAANGPFDPGYGQQRDRFFSLLVERAFVEEQNQGRWPTDAG
ncbi:MAG TPA: diguanylate cyclase [Rhodanobacter sp.]|nr:diguanylate cyclase [Rhodanobacter sp.]